MADYFNYEDFQRFKGKQVPAPPAGTADFNYQDFQKYKAQKEGQPSEPTRLPIGSVAGSIALPMAVPGPLPVKIGAGVIGAMGGESMQRMMERRLGIGPPPMPPKEELKNIGIQGAYQLGGDVLGRAGGAVLSKVLSPFGKTVTPEAKEAIGFLSQRGLSSPQLLPAEATSSRFLDFLHNIAEHGIGGMGKIAGYKETRSKMLSGIEDDILTSIAAKTSPDQAGKTLIEANRRLLTESKAPAEVIYTQLEKVFGGKPIINIAPLKQSLMKAHNIGQELQGIGSNVAGYGQIADIMKLPDTLTYSAAKELRTSLRTMAQGLSVENKSAPAIGRFKRIEGELTNAMREGLMKEDLMAAAWWEEANRIYKEGSKKFDNRLIRSLMPRALEDFKANPQSLVTGIQQLGPTGIKKWREAVTPDAWKDFQRVTAETVMASARNKEGELQGAQFLNKLIGKGEIGMERAKEIFDPSTLLNLQRLGKALSVIQSRAGAKEGTMWIQLTQASALGGLAYGQLAGDEKVKYGSLAILLSPPILAYVMTHPKLSNWFIEGIQLPAGSKQGFSILGKVLAAVPQTLISQPQNVSQPTATPSGPLTAFPLQP